MSAGYALEERVFNEVKHLCYAGLDTTTLRVKAAESLRRVVPFDAYCLFTTDPLTGLPTDVLAEGQQEGEGRFFMENILFEDDVNRFDWMARSRKPVALLSEGTGGRLDRALRHREILDPKGFDYELRSAFTVGRALWGGMELSRERGRPDFSDREVALIRRLAPHLGAGLKAAALRTQAPPEEDGDGVSGVLTLDHRGRVIQHTRAAKRWLQEMGKIGPGWRHGDELPAAIYTVVAALRHTLNLETNENVAAIPQVCFQTRAGRWLTLQADLTEPSFERPSEIVVVIEPAGPKEVRSLRTAAYDLSPREREIVDLVVRGVPRKQIAASLYISEYTVQEHLSNVFEKVGVRGRQALVKRLYLNTIFP